MCKLTKADWPPPWSDDTDPHVVLHAKSKSKHLARYFAIREKKENTLLQAQRSTTELSHYTIALYHWAIPLYHSALPLSYPTIP